MLTLKASPLSTLVNTCGKSAGSEAQPGDKRRRPKVQPPDPMNSSLLDQLLYSRIHGAAAHHHGAAPASVAGDPSVGEPSLREPSLGLGSTGLAQPDAVLQDSTQVCKACSCSKTFIHSVIGPLQDVNPH